MQKMIGWETFKAMFSGRVRFPETTLKYFHTPGAIRWPFTDETALQQAYEKTLEKIPHGLQEFFCLSFITSLLLQVDGKSGAIPSWISGSCEISKLLGGLSLTEAFRGTWRTVPVVVMQGNIPYIIHFLVGALLDSSCTIRFPDWATPLLDDEAKAAVFDTFTAAHSVVSSSASLCMIPLTCPDGKLLMAGSDTSLMIQGHSLGLSLGLGAVSALSGHALPDHWLATGGVDANGQILPINSLRKKFEIASESDKGYILFLHPPNNPGKNTLPFSECGIVTKEVGTLSLAKLWVERFVSLDAQEEVTRLETALQNPGDFMANCLGLSTASLTYCRKSGIGEKLYRQMRDQPQLALQFANCIETSLKERGNDHAGELAQFLDSENLNALGEIDAVAALSFCSSCLALANHCGQKEEEDYWYARGGDYTDYARRRGRGREVYVRFINRRFGVSDRHNNYFFNEHLPLEFKSILDKQRQVNKLLDDCTDYALGSLYGTLAQNYAFCGPRHLENTRKTIRAAMHAFGNSEDRTYIKDWSRQASYLLFALVDAKKFDEAEEILYLLFNTEKGGTITIDHALHDGFKLFAMARYLSDYPVSLPPYLIEPSDQLIRLISDDSFPLRFTNSIQTHPWQLVYFNIGRLAVQRSQMDIAQKAWRMSLELCGQGGETMQAMGLLPLSACMAASTLTTDQQEATTAILKMLSCSKRINKNHFADLLQPSIEDALSLVHKQPEKYFPFTYR